MKGAGKRTIAVEHPAFGCYVAVGVADKLEAVRAAAKEWGRQWSVICKESRFYENGREI